MQLPSLLPELYATLDDVRATEAAVHSASGSVRLAWQALLAWHLRQREKIRAQALASELQPGLRAAAEADARFKPWLARLLLVRAEQPWMDGDVAAAKELAKQALLLFIQAGDALGEGDAHWLLAHLQWQSAGSHDSALDAAADAYRRGCCGRRCHLLALRRMYSDSFYDLASARQQLADSGLAQNQDAQHPSVRAWLLALEGSLQSHEGKLLASLAPTTQAVEAALATGQNRMAAIWAGNIGIFYRTLNDLASSLEWQERALELARALASQVVQAMCLSQLGMVLGDLKRPEVAMEMLLAADAVLVDGSDAQAFNSQGIAQAKIAMGDWDGATHWLDTALAQLQACRRETEVNSVLLDLASVRLAQGRPGGARPLCEQALMGCRRLHTAEDEVRGQQLLARVCMAEGDAQEALTHLQDAVAVARAMPGLLMPPELLESMADALARRGDFAAAYGHLQEAAVARERIGGLEVSKRAAGLQVRFQTEALRQEAQTLSRLAESEARRASEATQARDTLAQLERVGMDLAAMVSEEGVFRALNGHIDDLMDASMLAICLFRDDPLSLVLAHGREHGKPLPRLTVRLDVPHSLMARCVRERRQIHFGDDDTSCAVGHALRGTQLARSVLLAPLLVGEDVLGVITVQSPRLGAYGERERSIFHTLCSYSAIALANAQAVQRLQSAQAQLVEKNHALERMAVTDALTGLPNRRHLDQALARELDRSARHGDDLSLLILDVDHFKRINDQHGHLVGDEVLANLGRLLSQRARRSDVVGRWGGEEFLVVCASTGPAQALQAAESLREAVAQMPAGPVGHCTISLGIASYRPGDTAAGLIARADSALYGAKQAGRNRVAYA